MSGMHVGERCAVIVTSVLVKHDAISHAALDSCRILNSFPATRASILTLYSDVEDVPVRSVATVADLLAAPEFLDADLILYHFGIYSPLFDAMLVGNGKAKQIVRFHNITPAHLVPTRSVAVIEKSFGQIANFTHVEALWADSRTNFTTLAELGYPLPPTQVIPLVVEHPARLAPTDKEQGLVEILFVGRMVPAKGVLDLLRAFAPLARSGAKARLRLVGNSSFSDDSYRAELDALAGSIGPAVECLGSVTDETRDQFLREAHILAIPSYHEGFCKPVIEGLRAGCIPAGYAAYNLPDICAGLGRLTPPGDIEALSQSLHELIEDLASVAADPANPLRLDRGPTSLVELGKAIDAHLLPFSFESVRERTRRAITAVDGHTIPTHGFRTMLKTRSMIDVRSDSEMRSAERISLNRLPDFSDWEPGTPITRIMQDLHTPISIHRKAWEYAICLHGLEKLGVIHPEAVGLAVGAGSEPPLYHYANTIRRMVATDLYDNEGHEGTPLMLREPERFAPFPYDRKRLEVLRMPGDTLDFCNNTYDFVFCLSSIEHFGSRETQRRSLDEMARVLKSGGVACIITELILTDHSDPEFFRWEELEDMFLHHPELELDGGAPDLSISESLLAFPVDLTDVVWPLSSSEARRINRSPHIVLRRGDMLWTSFSMFLRKK
ncbi:MAG: glycosyltransferase [Bosea sp. (in: a-proteobacteria)]|nr:glycosyltransferase [Bosea sp. (in: a-proteobacteria)]